MSLVVPSWIVIPWKEWPEPEIWTWKQEQITIFKKSKDWPSAKVKLTCLQNLSVMVAAVPDCLRQIPAQARDRCCVEFAASDLETIRNHCRTGPL